MLMLTMTKVLSDLLGADEPLFSIALQQLERASGQQSVDVRLTAEIIGKVHQKARELGLDPKDTRPEELYLALIELVKRHDSFLARRIGVVDPEDVQDVLPKIVSYISDLDVPKSAWVLKPSTAKRLLKATPPKKVMKQLGYRSVDSMLKREPIGKLYAALRFAETPAWLTAFTRKYRQLQPHDFETRNIEFHFFDSKQWGSLSDSFTKKNRHNITHMKEMGVIAILPLPLKRLPGVTIAVLPLVLHYINEIRLYSTYFKLQQVRPNFAHEIIDTILEDPDKHASMAGHRVHWRIIHRYFGSNTDASTHPEIFQPHVQPEDLLWRKTEATLYRIEPALHFWHDMDFVALQSDKGPISLNLMDVAVNFINKLPYGSHAVYHFRDSLWNEIFVRYMGQKSLEQQILRQLDDGVIAPMDMEQSFTIQEIF